MLIIKRIYQKFPERVVEWGLSYILMTWGSILLLNPDLFSDKANNAAYQGWNQLAPQVAWGYGALIVGMARLAALYVNGAHAKSPIARTVLGFCSMFIWFWATVGVLRVEVSTALCAYPWFMVGDAYAVYTASGDAYQSLHKEKKGHVATRTVYGAH